MARELTLPELAESVVEGEIVRWLVQEGESVALDQPVVEVMTDKVTVELPSPFAGVLEKHLVAEGDVVAVHAPIATFADEGTSAATTAAAGAAASTSATSSGRDGAAKPVGVQAAEERSIVESGAVADEDDGESLSLFKPSAPLDEGAVVQVRRPGGGKGVSSATVAAPTAVTGPSVTRGGTPATGGTSAAVAAPAAGGTAAARGPFGRVLAVPAARKLARELGVDVEQVPGSGPNGRVRVDDVRSFAAGGAADVAGAGGQPAATGTAARPVPAPAPYVTPAGYEEREERIPVRGLRRAIANQMVASHLATVRTLHVDEADVTSLVALRDRLKGRAEARGVRLSYLPFVMKAVVAALQEFPMLNASLDEAKNEIVRKKYYNVGMAVATDAGLVVPVVKAVEQRTILDIAADIQRLAAAAKAGKLAPDDVKGGTFSITNIGSLGGLFSFPIINVPEAAILGVHSIKKRPVVLPDDTIAARQMLYLSLSFDHRLVDGAEGALFTSRVIDLLETPEAMMLDL